MLTAMLMCCLVVSAGVDGDVDVCCLVVSAGVDGDVDVCGGVPLHCDSLQLLPQVLHQGGGRTGGLQVP